MYSIADFLEVISEKKKYLIYNIIRAVHVRKLYKRECERRRLKKIDKSYKKYYVTTI